MKKSNINESNLKKNILKLSLLSQETKGGSFVISHQKETGLFKITFPTQLENNLKYTELETAIIQGIDFIKQNRVKIKLTERYKLELLDKYKPVEYLKKE